MLENGDSNLQTKFGVHITSNIFKKKSNFKITGLHQPLCLNAYPTLGGGDICLNFFSLK